MERIIYKTVNELDFYNLNYTTSLAGDIINESEWSTTDSEMNISTPAPSVSGLVTQVWIGGGTLNTPTTPAEVTNAVLSQGGRDLMNSIKVVVQQYNFIPALVINMMPTQVADYTLNWAPRLLSGTDTIATSTWRSNNAALNVNAETPQIVGGETQTQVWMTGGVVGQTYIVTNTVTTAMGRTLEQSFIVVIKQYVNRQ